VLGDHGRALHRAALGIDNSPVVSEHRRQSISQERTFAQDLSDAEALARELLRMSEHVAASLRGAGQVAQTVRVKLRYADFSTVTRQMRLEQPTDQGQRIYEAASGLFQKHWHARRPLRLLGLGVSGLLDRAGYQLELFDNSDHKRARLDRALDGIRGRFGRGAIQRASLARREPHLRDEDAHGATPSVEPGPESRKPPRN